MFGEKSINQVMHGQDGGDALQGQKQMLGGMKKFCLKRQKPIEG